MRYLVNYKQDKIDKEYITFASSYEEARENALGMMKYLMKYEKAEVAEILRVEEYCKELFDLGFKSVDQYLYYYAKAHQISFEAALNHRKAITTYMFDEKLLDRINVDFEADLKVTLNEFIKMKDGGCNNYFNKIIIIHDKHKMKASVSGNEFNDYEHNIWELTGTSSIHSWKNDLDISIELLEKLIEGKFTGQKYCSHCHTLIKGQPKQYFAGIYCDKCYQKEWDEETYN